MQMCGATAKVYCIYIHNPKDYMRNWDLNGVTFGYNVQGTLTYTFTSIGIQLMCVYILTYDAEDSHMCVHELYVAVVRGWGICIY